MVEKERKVIWPALAREQLQKIYKYIKQDSLQNAMNVKKGIFESTKKLSYQAEVHPPDKYRINNDGSFRAYELYSYRIAYQITDEQVIIVRIRHTSMEPLQY